MSLITMPRRILERARPIDCHDERVDVDGAAFPGRARRRAGARGGSHAASRTRRRRFQDRHRRGPHLPDRRIGHANGSRPGGPGDWRSDGRARASPFLEKKPGQDAAPRRVRGAVATVTVRLPCYDRYARPPKGPCTRGRGRDGASARRPNHEAVSSGLIEEVKGTAGGPATTPHGSRREARATDQVAKHLHSLGRVGGS